MPVAIFIPSISTLALIQIDSFTPILKFLDAVWEKYLRPDQVKLSQLSLRTLTNPVPIEPIDTLHKRVTASARGSAWVHTAITGYVHNAWFDGTNIHVFLYVDHGVAMRAAENLHEILWGQGLNDNLKEHSENGVTWKYLPKEYLDSLQLPLLGYLEDVLLFREEYKIAMDSFNPEESMKGGSRGVVVTGQPGIGKSCFLYYLLLQQLSKKTSVALERPDCFFLFSEDGVTRHTKTQYTRLFPKITWALSDSNKIIEQPCAAFLDASQRGRTWVVQTTSPLEKRWEEWKEQNSAGMFIMKYFSVREITALGKILRLDVRNLQCIYNQWGPSARLCLRLLRYPKREHSHETKVIQAAVDFIKSAPTTSQVNILMLSHILFKMEPEGDTEELRQSSIGYIATDRIKNIILYAAAEAEAHERIRFYLAISKQPGFRQTAGKMFEDLVLSWFYGHSNGHMPCFAAQDNSSLQIPACGEDHTVFMGSKSAVQNAIRAKTLPLLLLPLSPAYRTADAIVLTEDFIITIQVTIADNHSVAPSGFAFIEEYLPSVTKQWCHVFISDNENGAASLRSQTLNDLPSRIRIYSAVFDVGTPSIVRKHVEEFNNRKQRELLRQQNNHNDNGADIEVE